MIGVGIWKGVQILREGSFWSMCAALQTDRVCHSMLLAIVSGYLLTGHLVTTYKVEHI